MTVVTFFRSGAAFLGFEARGHAGSADEGEDVVCAAITSAVRLAECQINDVLGLSAEVTVDDEDALVSVRFPEPCGAAQPVLQALYLYFTELAGEQPRFLKILEV